MIKVSITPEMMERATRKAEELGTLKRSFMQGEGNLIGFLGEEMVLRCLRHSKEENDYSHDIEFEGKRLEVKTKKTKVEPRPHYECSLVSYIAGKQSSQFYVFCRVHESMEYGWILGVKTPSSYMKQARFMKKGDIDPSNNYTVKADCYNLPIKDLDLLVTVCEGDL